MDDIEDTEDTTLAIRIARIDERVKHIHRVIPGLAKKVNKHDRDLLAAKIVAGIGLVLIALKFPQIAEVLTEVVK
jgi:hypothetical protein